jgi:ribosomal protein S27AE
MFEFLTNLENDEDIEIAGSAKNEYSLIEQKIDCPRCHSIMALHLEFDLPGYFCEECDFALRLTHYYFSDATTQNRISE